MSETPPLDKVWFKNTPENVAEFKRRWPDIRTVNGNDADFIADMPGCYGLSVLNGNLEWCQTESYYPSLRYTELDLTPKPEPLPSAFWFEYTPENVAEFKRRYPDLRGSRGSGSIDEYAEKIISLGNRIGEVGFACGSWGYTGPSNKGWYADQRTYQRLDLTPKPEPAKSEPEHGNIVELAKKCIGKRLDSVEMTDLSNALYCDGFKFLAKAVLGGIKWSKDVAKGESLKELELITSGPSWSWNQTTSTPVAGDSGSSIRQPKVTSVELLWDDMKTMFSGPLNYVSPVSSVSTKEKDMTPSEIQTVIDAVTKNLKGSVVKDTKQSIFSRATGYTWGATKSTFGWVFAPVKKITQLTACLVALSGIAYGGYRAYDAIANMSMPTITWEAQADSSPSDAK